MLMEFEHFWNPQASSESDATQMSKIYSELDKILIWTRTHLETLSVDCVQDYESTWTQTSLAEKSVEDILLRYKIIWADSGYESNEKNYFTRKEKCNQPILTKS